MNSYISLLKDLCSPQCNWEIYKNINELHMEEKTNINIKGGDSILLPCQFLNASHPNTMTLPIWSGSTVNKWVPCDTRQYFQAFHKLRKTSLLLWYLQTKVWSFFNYAILTCQNTAKYIFNCKCNWMLERCSFDFKFVSKLFLKVKSQRKYQTEMWTLHIKLTVFHTHSAFTSLDSLQE